MNTIVLKSFIRCKRKAWLDFNGNKSLQIWSPQKAIEVINQFKMFYNFFFLVIALTQFIPALKVGFLFTYIAPLVFVLAITIIKEAVDDI